MNELVLVVDDEQKIVKIARDYLEKSGYRVLSCADGLNALAAARSEKPDTRDVGMHADDEFLHARVGGVLDFGGEARPAEPVRAAAGRRRSYWRPCATFQ